MLVFAIPTWNRADRLVKAVETIAAQIQQTGGDTRILISDNASDDHTAQVVADLQARFGFIDYTCRAEHGDFSANLDHMFQHLSGDYCWLFGDDDILLPGALDLGLRLIRDHQPSLIHCCEVTRTSGQNRVISGRLIDLCNRFGWLELTGFLASTIVKVHALTMVPKLPQWPLYQENSFPHACAMLHQFAYETAMTVDLPLVSTQGQSESAETLARWAAENVSYKYFRVGDALEAMAAAGAIPAKLDKNFFRYHRFYLWDRFINNLVHEIYNRPRRLTDDIWRRSRQLAGLLADRELAKLVVLTIDQAADVCIQFHEAREAMVEADRRIRDFHTKASAPVVGYAIVDPDTLDETPAP